MSLSDLLDLLNQRFSLEDVRTLCFILRIEYDNLGGEGKKNKLRELILTLRQEGRLVELIDAAEEEKPNIRNLSWDDVRNDIANLQEEYFKNRPAENFNHDHTNPDTPVIPIPMQIPRLIPHFVGRERYLDEVRACLHTDMHQRVVGLVGLPGVGKTAIAIHALYGLQEEFTDGIIWVDVDISNPEAELTSIAAHFGQSEAVAAIPDLANKSEFVRDILLHKKLLLVLNQVDNEEQIKWLLPTGDNNYVLITTRNGHVLTRMGAVIIPVRPFTEMEAMVFLETAVGQQRVRQETQAAHNIIHNLGFLPLALSVASSQLEQAPNLTLAEFASLIEDEKTRLHNLSDWDSTERDITISLELSYRQLPDAHQQLFRALAVFDGPDFSAEAVAAVVNQPLTQVKLGLSRLFTHSLLGIGLGERHTILPIENQEKNRYRLNPLIKLFAQYKLSPPLKKEEEPPPPDKTSPQKASRSGWLSAANRTLGTPEPAPEPDPPLRGGWMQAAAQKLHQRTAHPPTVEPDQISEANQLFERATHHFINLLQANKYIHILTPIELEWPNIQNALEWAYVHQRWNLLANGVLPLIQNSIWGIGFMDAMGYWQEAISLIERNLEGRDELPPLTVAILLSHLGHYYRRLDQEEKTAAFLDEAEEIITTLPDTIDKLPSLIYIYEQRAHLVGQSEPDKAIPWLIKAIQLLSKTKLTERLRFQLGYTYLQLATFLAKIGQWDQGQKTVHQAFKLLPNSVNHSRIKGLLILSNIAAVQDNLHQRIQYLDEAIPIARELRDYRSLITLWGNLSISYKRLGKLEEALTIGKNVLSLCHRMGNIQHLIKVHVNQGQLYLRLGKYHNAWDHFTHAQENSNTFNSNQWFPLINLWFAQWKLAAGHLSEATQLIEEVENIGFKIDQSLMPVIHRVQAEIALANQEYGQALALLHKAFSSFDQHPSPIEEALCWRTQGLVFAAFHQYKGMNFAFQKSVDILTEKDYYEHAHTQYLWAKTLWEHQRPQPNPITLLQNVIPVFEEQKAIANLHEARLLLDKIERAQAPAH